MWPLPICATGLLILLASGWRWLNVAQKEHYEPGRVSWVAYLWLRTSNPDILILAVSSGVAAISAIRPDSPTLLLAIVTSSLFPVRMLPRLRKVSIKWTSRARRLAAIFAALSVAVVWLALWADSPILAWGAVTLSPALMDLSLAVARPLEGVLAKRYISSAQERIAEVSPRIIAITGSYGKTSTKAYVAHLISTSFATLASPASFNNILGLSRAVNDKLPTSTEVFIAEMGTYGPGEIRRLCTLFPPEIAAITTIGEAHLERMGSREAIVRAKSEIVTAAKFVVLNVDVPELAELAAQCRSDGKVVVECSTSDCHPSANVRVLASSDQSDKVEVSFTTFHDEATSLQHVVLPSGSHPINLAIAIGIAIAVGVPITSLKRQLEGRLPVVEHRATVSKSSSGRYIIDDTFNSNPAGALTALAAADRISRENCGRVIVVTPGMIELGKNQFMRNADFAQQVSKLDAELFIVGRSNRAALLSGVPSDRKPRVFEDREEAVSAAHSASNEGDVILFENDLPNHYP